MFQATIIPKGFVHLVHDINHNEESAQSCFGEQGTDRRSKMKCQQIFLWSNKALIVRERGKRSLPPRISFERGPKWKLRMLCGVWPAVLGIFRAQTTSVAQQSRQEHAQIQPPSTKRERKSLSSAVHS